MSVYSFAPAPDLTTHEEPFAFWENGFDDTQIQQIIDIGESLEMNDAFTGTADNKIKQDKIRKSQTSWITHTPESNFIYDQLAYVTRQINGQFFEYDLFGFVEDMQYTRYEGDGGHYSWHLDRGSIQPAPRKLSVVMQLSDPDEYEGGDLEFLVGSEPIKATKQKGIIYVFPSFVLHRVTPVTKGTRRSLVVWVSGPKFK
jgi:PKHD-type hydroxylase